MRSVVLTATLISTLWFGLPSLAAGQEPEQQPAPPPPPAPREVAVPRSERIVTRDPESRSPDRSGENRIPPGASGRVRAPIADGDRPAPRETASANESDRRRPPTTPTSRSVDNEDPEAQRRGSVRRPSGGSGGSGGSSGSRDRAVVRTNPPRDSRDSRVYVYPDYRYYNRYYDPWGYGGFGLGYFYYSPWGWAPGYYGHPGYYGYSGYGGHYGYGGRYGAYGYELGSVRLKVKPRDAEVFVDGYFAGQVDDFDGIFQALKLDSGGYRIEIRKPGYETLHFDVRVQPERTITYRGEMRPVP